MPEGWISNQQGSYLVRTQSRVNTVRPYVAGGYQSSLTAKEKAARQLSKAASGYGIGGAGGAFSNTTMSMTDNFFSPQLSTDFLELPQSLREKREIYRHFYNTDELVGQAIDLHTELPLSKVRLAPPKPRTCPKGFTDAHDYGKYILSRFEKMCKHLKLFQRMITMVHHYWLDGTVAIFAEDSSVETPMGVGHAHSINTVAKVTESGDAVEYEEEVWTPRENAESIETEYYQKNYRGWERIIILPIDKVKISTFSFTDQFKVELIPSDRDRSLIEKARQGDPTAAEMVEKIPVEVREYMEQGRLIPMGTDPKEGSFVYLLSGRKNADSEIGQSILDRCHLPGTPVLVRREGQVLQVPIEDMDPDTDLVLSGQGRWQEFEHGLRKVDEPVTLLSVSKVEGTVASTQDHKYPVLRDGSVLETEAQAIQPGDYLQVAQVPLTETLNRVDFVEVLQGVQETYKGRKSGNSSDLSLIVEDQTQDSVIVRYSRGETDPRKLKRAGDIRSILEWAAQLEGPVLKRSAELCEQFGLHPVTLKEVRVQLSEYGYNPVVLKNKSIRFEPFTGELPAQPQIEQTKRFPKELELDSTSGYFIGFWLGDGHISCQPGLDYGVLGITYGPNEPASVSALETGVKPLLDRMLVSWSESETGTGRHVFGYQDALVRWMASNFGHTSEDKHLPDWIFDAPKSFLQGLLRGFVDSDGDITHKKDGSVSVRMNNTNATLMEQVFLLCTSLGIPASKTEPTKARMVKQADGRLSPAKPMYAVHFTHGPSVKDFFESGFLAKRRDPDVWKDGRSGARHRVHEGQLYYRVKTVDTAHHEGLVYSLNVHEDHNFFVGKFNTFNCLRTLFYREKLRQAQTSIASRAMTPKRIVWAEGLSDADVEALREQVDLALVDPDYSIVANYEIRWEEMGARDRLLDLSAEYEQTERRLLTGLGVTEGLMSGETLYSGDRLKLEVINMRYLHLREILQEYVHEYLFEPVARRMGFVEKDQWGQEVVLYPRLSFTRLPLRDSQDTFDALFNLYQKGSVTIDVILEMLNIDPEDTRTKLEEDLFTVNDSSFNEVIRSASNEVGRMLVEKYNVTDKVAGYLKLQEKAGGDEDSGGRF